MTCLGDVPPLSQQLVTAGESTVPQPCGFWRVTWREEKLVENATPCSPGVFSGHTWLRC